MAVGFIRNAYARGVDNWLVSPGGYLKVYSVENNTPTTISSSMPHDLNHQKFK